MSGKYTRAGLQNCAARLDCDVLDVRTVLVVETAGRGFFADGRPVILFERHVFSRLTERKFDGTHPDVSNPVSGGYLGDVREYGRLYKALQLDGDAAIQSCSWGIGQVMGFNYAMTGEKSLYGFLLAMHNNEDVQLMLMAEYIIHKGAASALRRHDWAEFAKLYNGRDYRRNEYDTRLADAHAKLSKQAIA